MQKGMNKMYENGLIGVVGLGRLGRIVTARLTGQHRLVVYDRNAELVKAIAELHGAAAAGRLTELACCNIVLLALPDKEIVTCIRELNSLKKEMLVINMATNAPQKVVEEAAEQPLRCTSVKFVGHAGEMALGFNPVIIVNEEPADQVQAVSKLFQSIGRVVTGQADIVTEINTIAAQKALEAGVRIEQTLQAKGYNHPAIIESAIAQVGAGILKSYATKDLGPFAQDIIKELKMKEEV